MAIQSYRDLVEVVLAFGLSAAPSDVVKNKVMANRACVRLRDLGRADLADELRNASNRLRRAARQGGDGVIGTIAGAIVVDEQAGTGTVRVKVSAADAARLRNEGVTRVTLVPW